jgi:hypothetical protein
MNNNLKIALKLIELNINKYWKLQSPDDEEIADLTLVKNEIEKNIIHQDKQISKMSFFHVGLLIDKCNQTINANDLPKQAELNNAYGIIIRR